MLVCLSATPQPVWLYALWALIAAAFLILGEQHWIRLGKTNAASAAVALVLISFLMIARELPFHLRPRLPLDAAQAVYVIGDSLSAGISREETPWPNLLEKKLGVPVINLAQAGATTALALRQIQGVTQEDSAVIVEIGGNDLLSGKSPAMFNAALDALLEALSRKHCRLIMFELPLPPTYNRYGEAQRTLAARYQVTLLPKWYLTRALGAHEGTLDGLHLSQASHELLAGEVAATFRRTAE